MWLRVRVPRGYCIEYPWSTHLRRSVLLLRRAKLLLRLGVLVLHCPRRVGTCVGFGNIECGTTQTKDRMVRSTNGPNGPQRSDGSACMHACTHPTGAGGIRRCTSSTSLMPSSTSASASVVRSNRFFACVAAAQRAAVKDATMRCAMIQRCDDATVVTLPNVRVRATRRGRYAAV